MALPTVADLKLRFKVETDQEDTMLADMLVSAIAAIETYIKRVILDDPLNPRTFGPTRAAYPTTGGRFTGASVVDEFTTSPATLPVPAPVLGALPMSTLPDYAQRWEQLFRQAITDLVADFYTHRNPLTAIESQGGGVMVSYGRQVHGLPARVRMLLKPVLDLSTT